MVRPIRVWLVCWQSALAHHTITLGTVAQITDPVHAQAIDIIAVDGQAIGPTNFAARDLITEIAALDPSTRPSEITTPWPIEAQGFFTDPQHPAQLHLAFTSPSDYQPTPTPAAAPAPAPAAAAGVPVSGPTPDTPAAQGAAQAAAQALAAPPPTPRRQRPAHPNPQPHPRRRLGPPHPNTRHQQRRRRHRRRRHTRRDPRGSVLRLGQGTRCL